MKNCENCEKEHDGIYGTGRFCSMKCARGFSTKSKRKEINNLLHERSGVKYETLTCENLNCENQFRRKVESFRKFCSISCAQRNKKVSEITRERQSIKRSKFLQENNSYNCGFYEFYDNKGNRLIVQGTWEKRLAEKLQSQKIEWTRIFLRYDRIRRYTPDFYLPNEKLYLEVKGFMRERDKRKMWKVIDEHDIKILLVESLECIENFNLLNLEDFSKKYPKDSINFEKFNDHWNGSMV